MHKSLVDMCNTKFFSDLSSFLFLKYQSIWFIVNSRRVQRSWVRTLSLCLLWHINYPTYQTFAVFAMHISGLLLHYWESCFVCNFRKHNNHSFLDYDDELLLPCLICFATFQLYISLLNFKFSLLLFNCLLGLLFTYRQLIHNCVRCTYVVCMSNSLHYEFHWLAWGGGEKGFNWGKLLNFFCIQFSIWIKSSCVCYARSNCNERRESTCKIVHKRPTRLLALCLQYENNRNSPQQKQKKTVLH